MARIAISLEEGDTCAGGLRLAVPGDSVADRLAQGHDDHFRLI